MFIYLLHRGPKSRIKAGGGGVLSEGPCSIKTTVALALLGQKSASLSEFTSKTEHILNKFLAY